LLYSDAVNVLGENMNTKEKDRSFIGRCWGGGGGEEKNERGNI